MADWNDWHDIDIEDFVILNKHRVRLKRWFEGPVSGMPHILLLGDYGTGKTSVARMIMKAFNWQRIVEIDASNENARSMKKLVDEHFSATRRATLEGFFGTSEKSTRSLYFYDEFHNISSEIQGIFHVPLEGGKEFSCAIFATNDLNRSRSGGLDSRCRVINMGVTGNKGEKAEIEKQMVTFGSVLLKHFDADDGTVTKTKLKELAKINFVERSDGTFSHDVRSFVQNVEDAYKDAKFEVGGKDD